MASNQTSNYGLNQWTEEDRVLREEFNRDNANIDAVISDTASKMPRVVTGSFAGTGEENVTLHYSLGSRPKMVIVRTDNQNASKVHDQGFILTEIVCISYTTGSILMQAPGVSAGFEDKGFYIIHDNDSETNLNCAGSRLYYWAWL